DVLNKRRDKKAPKMIEKFNMTESQNQAEKLVSFEDYFDPSFPRWISIALLFIGLFGNSLCLVIFSHKSMRKHSTFIYLAFLSMVDLTVLTLGLGEIILISYFHLVVRNKSLIICRILSFFIYGSTHLSSFIIASVSIDRAIATNMINFSKTYCTPKTAFKIIFFNIFLTAVINFHNLIFMGHTEPTEIANASLASGLDYLSQNLTKSLLTSCICGSKKDTLYDKFLDPVFKWVDLLSYAIIPFIIMAICTFLITRVLFLSNKRLNRNKKQSKSLLKKPNHKSNKAKHLTYTLITLNCLFFCLVSPLLAVLIILKGKETDGRNKIVINIVYLLAYSNHSFNFVLYGFSSPPFRELCIKLFRIKKDKLKTSCLTCK
ncbi:FMRFamide receptor-like, partial [Brachionus plicatilis]